MLNTFMKVVVSKSAFRRKFVLYSLKRITSFQNNDTSKNSNKKGYYIFHKWERI